MILNNGKYYLYRHIRLDKNEPFYIGVGKKPSNKNDGIYRRARQKAGRNIIWKRIVAKTEYEVEILMESDDRNFILEKEKEFVKLYGRIDNGTGILTNLTDGGDYFDGFIDTIERRTKISKGNKGKILKPETISKIQISRKLLAEERGYYFTEEALKRMSEKKKGRKLTKESIEKRTKTQIDNKNERGYWHSKESYIKAGDKHRESSFPLEKRLNILEDLKLGKSFADIQRKYKTCHQSIQRIIKEFNINYKKIKNGKN
jgi:Mor family transcriptional regulator